MFKSVTIDLPATNSLKIPLAYKALEDREIYLKLSDSDGKKIIDVKFIAYAGYANLEYDLKLKENLKRNKGYSLMAKIQSLSSEKPTELDLSTLIINAVKTKK